MRTTPEAELPIESSDAELVAHAQTGGRDAFARIVARYQALVCALAYNATGSLTRSEDLAQEAFVIAWKQLPTLREPGKLRSWLCGIVRNLGRRAQRDARSEPVFMAESLEAASSLVASEPHPLDRAISTEEEEILWRHLGAIPEAYREPLILFYRQHASIGQVALAMGVSEELVRQRLSRGRKLLEEQVLAFVESALARTSPKAVFTQQVLAALPAFSSAKAIGMGLAAASGSAAKGLSASAGPLGALLAMAGGIFVSRRALATDDTKSPLERAFLARFAWIQVAAVVIFLAIAWTLTRWELRSPHAPVDRDITGAVMVFAFWVVGMGLWRFRYRRQFQIQREDGTLDEREWGMELWKTPRAEGLPKPGLSYPLLLRRSAISGVFVVIMAFRAPWRHHFAAALISSVIVPLIVLLLSVFLVGRALKKGRRFQRPSLRFLFCFPVGLTLLAVDLDLLNARSRGVASGGQIVGLDAAIVLAYAIWAALFVRRGTPPLRRPTS